LASGSGPEHSTDKWSTKNDLTGNNNKCKNEKKKSKQQERPNKHTNLPLHFQQILLLLLPRSRMNYSEGKKNLI